MRRLVEDRGGAVAVMVALSLVPLLGLVGLGVDAGRAYLVEAKLSQALDAAGLAGGRVMFEPSRDDQIRQYFAANFPDGYMGARVTPLVISSGANDETLTVSASAQLDTGLMQLLGRRTMTVGTETQVHRAARGMELALVMDNTGSMQSNGKIDAMKAGATELIDILFGERSSIPNVWVSLVPYVASVNPGPSHAGWLKAGELAKLNYYTNGWKGCVEARLGANELTDAPPAAEKFMPYRYPKSPAPENRYPPVDESMAANLAGGGSGPNRACPDPITPMQTDKAAIKAAIGRMGPWHRGGTMGHLGLLWGWSTLSPRWRGLWSAATPQLPLDYGTAYMDKVVVMLTDGNNQWSADDYTAYDRLSDGRLGTTNINTAKTRLDQRQSQVCTALKQQGIVIYTITVQLAAADASTRALYQGCASKPAYYFDTSDNTQLRTSFRQIANSLSNLRLAR